MNTDKAIHEAQRWLGYLDAQKAKAKKLAQLARLAKTDHAEALRQKRQMDAAPTVYDGGNLEPAVRFLIAEIERLKSNYRQVLREVNEQSVMLLNRTHEIERLREAVTKLLACPAIADEDHSDPEWGCAETREAEAFARAALAGKEDHS